MVSDFPTITLSAQTLTCSHCGAKRSIPGGLVVYGGQHNPVEEWSLLHGACCPEKPRPTTPPPRPRWTVTLEVRS